MSAPHPASQALEQPANCAIPQLRKTLKATVQWQNLLNLIVLENTMLRVFERRLDPFPPDEVPPPPDGLARFLWACTRGARGYILAFALLSACLLYTSPSPRDS